ncbi:MAG: methylated-DNA--[protein]-cysteine S-methyltransferase [Turicibacter sp.]
MTSNYYAYYDSPIGLVEIKSTKNEILSVLFIENMEKTTVIPLILQEALLQLDQYFKGELSTFNLKLRIDGSVFQEKVWRELMHIPYGETRSYKQIAQNIGQQTACRAVGGANNKNLISIIIPCHRVIGANNKLVGYEGGLDRKEWLLAHEKKALHRKM